MDSSRPLVSVVIPAMNEAECLPRLLDELRAACDPLPYRFEFLFVDDGSTDETLGVLAALRRRDERVKYLGLSRNFGHQAALSAGLAHASGDAVVMMDGDGQHPPRLIPELIDRWAEGFDVVNTVRVRTEAISAGKRLWSWAFYRVFNWATRMAIEPGGADFRLMARPAVDALVALPERHRFLRGLVPWLGFRQAVVEFRAPARWAGASKYNFRKNLRFALEGLTAFSFYPLRMVTVLGWVVAASSLVYGLIAVGCHLFGGRTVPGWTSLMVCMLFLGGCQLISQGVLSEYLGRTLEQVKGRPLYIVREAVGFASRNQSIPPHHLTRGAPAGRGAESMTTKAEGGPR